MAVDWVELSNIIRNVRLISTLQKNVWSQFASNNGYIGRQVHPKHSHHFALFFFFFNASPFAPVVFPNPETK